MIAICHCMPVSCHGLAVAGKSAHQHDEGAFRQMEIGDQAVHHLILIARVNEDGGIIIKSTDLI